MEEASKGKNCKAMVIYISCLSRITIAAGETGECLLSKDWLGSKVGCLVTTGVLETIRLQLAAASGYCFENGWRYPQIWYS